MGVYLGSSEKLALSIGSSRSIMHVGAPMASTNRLLSLDNYILQDSNGLFLIPKEDN